VFDRKLGYVTLKCAWLDYNSSLDDVGSDEARFEIDWVPWVPFNDFKTCLQITNSSFNNTKSGPIVLWA